MRVELAFEFVGELCSVYKFGVEHMEICEGVAKEVILFYKDHLLLDFRTSTIVASWKTCA